MITIVARGVVKDGLVEEYIKVAKKMMEATRKEKGCISYTLYQEMNDPQTFCFIEHWENQECIDGHNASEHFKTLVPIMREMRSESAVNHFMEP